jgi:hypothetical protein
MPLRLTAAVLLVLAGCAPRPTSRLAAPPADLLGPFVDDYGNAYAITAETWTQLPHGRFHIVRRDDAAQTLVARNDTANTHAPGLWTRIDWVRLDGMAPYTWAYCLTAYEAPTQAAAEATPAADRAAPRTGCNGYPFSRMRRPDTG